MKILSCFYYILFIPRCVLGCAAHSGSLAVRWQITGVEPSPFPLWAPGVRLDGKYLYLLSHFPGPDAVFKNNFLFILSWLVVPSCLDYTWKCLSIRLWKLILNFMAICTLVFEYRICSIVTVYFDYCCIFIIILAFPNLESILFF